MNTAYHWVRNYMLGRKARLVLREAHRKEGSLLDLVREPDTLPIPCSGAAGRWKLWKRMRRRVPLPKNISIWM